jgi:predicted RNA-binding protein with RPS1 domain
LIRPIVLSEKKETMVEVKATCKRLNLMVMILSAVLLLHDAHGFQYTSASTMFGAREQRVSRSFATRTWDHVNRLSFTRCFESSPTAGGVEVPPSSSPDEPKPCMWRPTYKGGRWHERINLEDLKVGQNLTGYVVEELLGGKTGPKIFFECGVGRKNNGVGKYSKWNIVNGMLRLNREKIAVTKKRATRLRKKEKVELYVSRVQPGCGRLEVCLDPEDVKVYKGKPKVPVTSLKVDQEVKGEIVKLLPYGVMVDVGANRLGLLHIQKVADLYEKYVDKEKGLFNFGLERGAKVRLKVAAIEERRISLDFTNDVKEQAKEARAPKSKEIPVEVIAPQSQKDVDMSEEELASWAAYSAGEETSKETNQEVIEENEEDEEEEDDDDYDEDKDIEDAMGLGTY